MGNATKRSVIIVSPSLDTSKNVSGISSVTQFIIDNNKKASYIHFELGRNDGDGGGWHRILTLAGRYKAWKRLLAKNPDALIHYNFPLSRGSLLRDPWFIGYAVRRHRQLVIHVHGGLFLTATRIPAYLSLVLHWVFNRRVPFIVLSGRERETVMGRFGAKDVSVLPNCVDLSDARAYAVCKEAGSVERPLRVGYLGRIEPNKGIRELLAASQKLKENGIPFLLKFAGKEQTAGEFLPQFAKGLGGCFCYEGVVSGLRKRDFLRNLDIFLLPSYFEGLPMSLLECMSYGVTPVVTPVGSIPEVVKDRQNGIFIKPHDVDSIVEAVKLLDGDRPFLRRLGREASRTIFKDFSPEKYVECLNIIYSKA